MKSINSKYSAIGSVDGVGGVALLLQVELLPRGSVEDVHAAAHLAQRPRVLRLLHRHEGPVALVEGDLVVLQQLVERIHCEAHPRVAIVLAGAVAVLAVLAVLAVAVSAVELAPTLLHLLLRSVDALQLVRQLVHHLQLPPALAPSGGRLLPLLRSKRSLRRKVGHV
jgi:hypothetical protein